MADHPFTSQATIKLTSTAADQSTAIPANADTMVVYNGGTRCVYLMDGAAASVPATLVAGLTCVAPGSTQSFSVARRATAGTLHYIADTTGGELVVSFGNGS